ncbi:LLM class F420-dependent oxidoreductase [Mycobacteroides franklinii]|uniref:LLM class F420-dependent oxidoreductase n=1 Tax=Mycobacteroides franklinii TaxID=948102 RepID=A0A1S1L483_9MYCO|nr:LLM class F420-dependent oxidoreductase [Mycobacteroides franklinii]OHU19299.1 LLM class F420-dependent oxidoreductase [Mycobacteroides franklinii]
MTIRLGYQIPNFSYGTGVAELFPTVVQQVRDAEASGFDTVFVMDHFYQLPMIGTPDQPMLEAYTALGALASATSTIQLSTLVTGNTYRNPTLLAKAVTTLDVVSGGRAILGIGAGWFELEHQQLGFDFGTFTDRFERLSEALEIIPPMLRGERPTFEGKYYRTESALNEPRIRPNIPIMIGGSGEKKTFGLAVKYADHLNLLSALDEIPHKLAVLRQRCEEAGRDPSTLETSAFFSVFIDDDSATAWKLAAAQLSKNGIDLDTLPDEARAQVLGRTLVGSPDEIAEQVQTRVLDQGIDSVTLNAPVNGHLPGVVELIGKTLRPLFKD